MKDFVRVCKSMGLARTTHAIDLCDKWASTTWNTSSSDSQSDQGSEQSSAAVDLMNYNNKPRETPSLESDSFKQRVQAQHEKMLKWYKIQSTFL